MKNLFKYYLAFIISCIALAPAYSQAGIELTVVDACTGLPVPNGEWLTATYFSGQDGCNSGPGGVPAATYTPWITGGMMNIFPNTTVPCPDPEMAGSLSAINGATIVSVTPPLGTVPVDFDITGVGSLDIVHATVALNLPMSFNINGYIAGTTIDYLVNSCGSPLTMNTNVPYGIAGYELIIEEGTGTVSAFSAAAGTTYTYNYPSATSVPATIPLYSLCPALTSYTGAILVKLILSRTCTKSNEKVEYDACYDIQANQKITALSEKVNGVAPSHAIFTFPTVSLCNFMPLTLDATEAGPMENYTVKVEEGYITYSFPSPYPIFNPVTTFTHNYYTSVMPATTNLYDFATGASNLETYHGYIRVTVTANSACNSMTASGIYNLQHLTNVGPYNFTLNTITGPSTTAGVIPTGWICGTTSPANLDLTLFGSYTNVTITASWGYVVSSGTSTGEFVPYVDEAYRQTYASPAPPEVDLNSLPMISGTSTPFRNYIGSDQVLQVTVTVVGPCNARVKTEYFKLIYAQEAVAFQMDADFCPGEDCLPIYTGPIPIPFHDFSGGTTACVPGWQGANTAGICVGSDPTPTSYEVKIYSVDPASPTYAIVPGSSPILDLPETGYALSSLNFDVLTPVTGTTMGYFSYNYNTINGDNNVPFVVTVSALTPGGCTPSLSSYFKIANCPTCRMADHAGTAGVITPGSPDHGLKIYPNPAENDITVEVDNTSQISTITIFDMAGRKLIDRTFGSVQLATVSLSGLASGTYMVKVNDSISRVISKE